MANDKQQLDTQYREIVVEKSTLKPVFVWNRVVSGYYERQVPAIALTGMAEDQEVEFVLQGKPFSRFLQFMEIGKRKFLGMMYQKSTITTRNGQRVKKSYIGTTEAQKFLDTTYPEAVVQKFKILLVDNKVARITSEDYIGIPHSFVQEVIENRLKEEGIEFDKDIRFGGVNGVYTMKNAVKKGAEIAKSISYMNRNSGDKSFKLFGGAVVLVCSNGMTTNKATSEMRIVHKLEMSALKVRIEKELGAILEKIELLPKEFLKLRKVLVTKEEAKERIESLPLPKYLQDAIWARLFTPSKQTRNGEMDWDGSMWGLYMASTYIATHVSSVQRSKNTTKEVDEGIVERLQSLELFTTKWEKREKELEKTDAVKIEAKSN